MNSTLDRLELNALALWLTDPHVVAGVFSGALVVSVLLFVWPRGVGPLRLGVRGPFFWAGVEVGWLLCALIGVASLSIATRAILSTKWSEAARDERSKARLQLGTSLSRQLRLVCQTGHPAFGNVPEATRLQYSARCPKLKALFDEYDAYGNRDFAPFKPAWDRYRPTMPEDSVLNDFLDGEVAKYDELMAGGRQMKERADELGARPDWQRLVLLLAPCTIALALALRMSKVIFDYRDKLEKYRSRVCVSASSP